MTANELAVMREQDSLAAVHLFLHDMHDLDLHAVEDFDSEPAGSGYEDEGEYDE